MTNATGPKPGTHNTLAITPATVRWQSEGPRSSNFDDRYFHPEDGAGESRYVFLEHNQLPERFAELHAQTFIIVETGFGTGLNLLETIALFKRTAPPTARLQFISCDKHPLTKTDLAQASAQATAQWPHLTDGYAELIAQYPPLVRGTQCIRWSDPRIQVLLWWEDIQTMLANLNQPIDAWFLDGFAPSRNPAMWSETVYAHMKRLATPNVTTFATFTAASAVRRALEATGFNVTRAKGYGHKRHMLHGVADTPAQAAVQQETAVQETVQVAEAATVPPWFQGPAATRNKTRHAAPRAPKSVAVIGAGIAGLTTAFLLSEAGYDVSLFDRAAQPMLAGSGNPQAVLYTRLSPVDQPANRFHNSAFQCAINHLERLQKQAGFSGFTASGALEKLETETIRHWETTLSRCFHDPDWISVINHLPSSPLAPKGPLLYFPRAGWFAPAALAQALLGMSSIKTFFGHAVTALTANQDPATGTPSASNLPGWSLHWEKQIQNEEQDTERTGTCQTDAVILCAPDSIQQLLPGFTSQLRPLPGQINQVPCSAASADLKTVFTGPCSFLPAHEGYHTIGSTYRPGSTDDAIRAEDSQKNIEQLQTLSPALSQHFAALSPEDTPARAATRWNTRDYLPLIGPMPDIGFYEKTYGNLGQLQKRLWPTLPRAAYLPNLWINTGHGSRGFTQSWLAAEIMLAYFTQAQVPVDQGILTALHPARYFMRDLRQRTR